MKIRLDWLTINDEWPVPKIAAIRQWYEQERAGQDLPPQYLVNAIELVDEGSALVYSTAGCSAYEGRDEMTVANPPPLWDGAPGVTVPGNLPRRPLKVAAEAEHRDGEDAAEDRAGKVA